MYVAKYCYFCWNLSEPPTDLSLQACAVSKFQLPCVPGKEPDWRTCGGVVSMENCFLPILPRKVSKSWRRCEQTWISRLNLWFDRQKPECCFTNFELIPITFLVQYQYHYSSLSSTSSLQRHFPCKCLHAVFTGTLYSRAFRCSHSLQLLLYFLLIISIHHQIDYWQK